MIIKESMIIAVCCGFCLTSIVLMVLSIVGYCLFTDSFQNYELIISNWKQYPISDIRISQSHSCETDVIISNLKFKKELVLNNYQFPGTYNGCDCRHSYSFRYYGMYSSSCSFNQTMHGCSHIYAVENRRFWTFTDPKAEQKFIMCGVLDKTYNFYQHASQSNTCKEHQMKCGSDPDNFICTYNNKCPIIELGYQGENTNSKNEYIKLSDSAQLWYNRESNNQMPLVEMRVAEGEGVCLLNNERSITKGRRDYFLMRDKKEDCERDPRFQLLYKIDEYTFYSINDSLDLPNKLPEFSINQIYKWGLYRRGYIPWKQSCRGDILKQFKEQEPLLNYIHKMQLTIMIISIIHLCIFGLINILQFKFEVLTGFSYVGNIISLGICLILITIQYRKARSEVQLFRDIVDKQCSDKVTQQTLILLADSLEDDIYSFNYGLFILLIIVIIFSTSIICITGFYKYRESRNNQDYEGEYNNDQEQGNYLRGSTQNNQVDPFHEPIPFYRSTYNNY